MLVSHRNHFREGGWFFGFPFYWSDFLGAYPRQKGKNVVERAESGEKAAFNPGKARVVESLVDRYQLETKSFSSIQYDPDRFCIWFHRRSSAYKRPTFICYRKWVSGYLRSQGHEVAANMVAGVVWANEPAKQAEREFPVSGGGLNNEKGLATAELSSNEVRYLLNLANSDGKNGGKRYRVGVLTSLVFESTCMTGLRIGEWCNAKAVSGLSDNGVYYNRVLEVVTSPKGTGSRSEASVRRLLCDHFTDAEWDKVLSTLSAFEVIRDGYSRIESDGDEQLSLYDYYRHVIFRPMATTLTTLCKRLFDGEQKVTPYTARHLYAAEFRRGRCGDKHELAAAMGHTDIINQRYYGDAYESQEARRFTWSLALPHSLNVVSVSARVKERAERSMARLRRSLSARDESASPVRSGSESDFDFDV